MELVRADRLTVGYSGVPAVHEASLSVSSGELVVLLGPNGAGKTTLMSSLVGGLTPMSGGLTWCGKRMPNGAYRRARMGIGYVAEERSVFMNLTTMDNLRLGRGPVEVALDIFPELGKLLKRKAGVLSGGEQQMLTLARALAAAPKLLLADELSLGLAPMIVDRLLHTLRDASRGGLGVLLVEQHVRRALVVADRGYVMQRGRIVIEGPADDLRENLSSVEDSYLSSASQPPNATASLTTDPGTAES
jgi:branched-chain amino acid transport system ATP-binding protein